MQTNFVNISTYLFTPLSDLKRLRTSLLTSGKHLNLKGTVLLSNEGINLFISGLSQAIDEFLENLRRISGLENLQPKFSESSHQPFNRFLVRIKKEIIAFGVEGINPAKRTSPKLSATELKRWLEEGKEITLLDTRNDYEIKLGTFQKALPIGINHFREFPKAVARLPEELKKKPIVMFCTGGIRCEKAGPYLESQGFENVFQLDGGILKYFEECGNHHYDGDCFVFDQRVGVDPSLQESQYGQCFACLTPLTAEEQNDFRFQEGRSCPYCFQSKAEQMQKKIDARNGAFQEIEKNLPGASAYENFRPVKVPAKFSGFSLIDFLEGILRHVPHSEWEALFQSNSILDDNRKVVSPDRKVKAGERYWQVIPATIEPEVNARVKIIFEDETLVVLEKPAPLPVHPCGRYNRNTLQYFLDKVFFPLHPRPAHRLDANTTGIMLVAKTRFFAGVLQKQFETGEVEKKYLARVWGHPTENTFRCDLAISDKPQWTGSRSSDENGLPSETHFKVLSRFEDGTAYIEVKPITGRTNQIRVHLWELGFPIYGDQLYLAEKKLGKVQTNSVEDSPLFLHASQITFTHPLTKKRLTFSSETPSHFCSGFDGEKVC